MTYQAPIDDIVFALETVAGLNDLGSAALYPGLDAETITAVIREAGHFGAEVLAPLNAVGDRIANRHTG